MKRSTIVAGLVVVLASGLVWGGVEGATRWRGPAANGIYPDTGLLREWPEGGLRQLWKFDKLGEGFSSPAISGGFIYIPTMIDKKGFLFKLTMDGKEVWRREYGDEYFERYPGARGSVTVAGEHLYLLSGRGRAVCMMAGGGSLVWAKDLVKDLDGVLNRYGFNETLVVEGERIYCTPGGKDQSVVALNRLTGEVIGRVEGRDGDKAAYCTPLLVEHGGRKLLVTHTERNILGIDRKNGKLLWSFPWVNRMLEHQNTPLYHNGSIFCFSGYGKGAVMLELSSDGSSVKERWQSKAFDNRMGGAVVWDGYIYGCGHRTRDWQCIEWESGRVAHTSRELTMGVVIAADGMLYCYDEQGWLALVKPGTERFNIVSRMRIRDGSGSQWAHPVIDKGILYIARGNSLMAYDLRQDQ